MSELSLYDRIRVMIIKYSFFTILLLMAVVVLGFIIASWLQPKEDMSVNVEFADRFDTYDQPESETFVDSNRELSTGPVLESDTVRTSREETECDYVTLTLQLEEILEADGWYQYEVPLAGVSNTVITEYPHGNQDLPFDYSEVCAVKFFFEESHLDWLDGASSRKNFWHDYSYQEDYVELGSQRFYGNPADGPLSSADVIPILSSTGGLQYLMQSSGTSVTEFRPEIKCPCTNYYEAWLTAPMYPLAE